MERGEAAMKNIKDEWDITGAVMKLLEIVDGNDDTEVKDILDALGRSIEMFMTIMKCRMMS